MSTGLPSVWFDRIADDVSAPPAAVVAEAAQAFRQAGCVLLHDVLDTRLVDEMRAAFLARHRRYLVDRRRHLRALGVGDRRWMVTVRLRPPFSDPRVYANRFVLPVVRELLETPRLLAFGGVVSLPGAEDQHVHRDGPLLFGAGIGETLPPHAISAVIPLIDIDDVTGTTRTYPGSHCVVADEAGQQGYVDPVVPRGSVLLMDYRLRHGGTANRSPNPRPVLYNVYAEPWFRDDRNYTRQKPLVMGTVERRRVPAAHRDLFAGPGGAWSSAAQRIVRRASTITRWRER